LAEAAAPSAAVRAEEQDNENKWRK
jgi:hypothetical protein